jgi:hypothetical protein
MSVKNPGTQHGHGMASRKSAQPIKPRETISQPMRMLGHGHPHGHGHVTARHVQTHNIVVKTFIYNLSSTNNNKIYMNRQFCHEGKKSKKSWCLFLHE